MFNFFDTIVTYFQMLWEYISNMLSALLNTIKVLLTAVILPQTIIGYLPGIIGSSLIIVSGVAIAKLILGWSGES